MSNRKSCLATTYNHNTVMPSLRVSVQSGSNINFLSSTYSLLMSVSMRTKPLNAT
ncbi:hypothetical protein OGCDGJMD_01520 [Cyanobium usitatum str. Tous]|nr:hypothetical protein OGCDGJMD_01520 [Cyanobium usitatum str. Tous]